MCRFKVAKFEVTECNVRKRLSKPALQAAWWSLSIDVLTPVPPTSRLLRRGQRYEKFLKHPNFFLKKCENMGKIGNRTERFKEKYQEKKVHIHA